MHMVCKARMAHKACKGVGKNSIDLIGCGGTLTNQNPARRAHKVCKVRKAHKGVGKNSIDLIGYGGDINQSESCKGCA